MKVNVSPRQASELDDAVGELQQLLVEVFRNLKSAGMRKEELAPLKRAFFEAGLRDRHARLLLTLASTGPMTVGELADRMGLASATTSLLAGELQRAGFLERREDDDDRRRTILSLPGKLAAQLADFAGSSAEPLRRTLEQLGPAARSQFLRGLRLLADEARETGR